MRELAAEAADDAMALLGEGGGSLTGEAAMRAGGATGRALLAAWLLLLLARAA